MDAWSDEEGKVFFLDEPGPAVSLLHEAEPAPERAELDGRMLSINAVSILLERSRFEAATALHACQIELEVGDSSSYAEAPVWVVLKAPAELVFTLGNLDRAPHLHRRQAARNRPGGRGFPAAPRSGSCQSSVGRVSRRRP